MLTFLDRENAGNLFNLILTQGKSWQNKGNCVLVVNKSEEKMAVRGGGGNLQKKNCYLCIEKHREVG